MKVFESFGWNFTTSTEFLCSVKIATGLISLLIVLSNSIFNFYALFFFLLKNYFFYLLNFFLYRIIFFLH